MEPVDHPTYPIRHGIPAMDRCICGGVRHWHAESPNGCDDCDCEAFYLDESWRPPALPLPEPPREIIESDGLRGAWLDLPESPVSPLPLTRERIDAVIASLKGRWAYLYAGTPNYKAMIEGAEHLRDALLKEGE